MAGQKVPPPIFTLRGHTTGVTALTQFQHNKEPYLISGDEEGSISIWNLIDFRRFKSHNNLVPSRVQSLKVVHLGDSPVQKSLIVQSRDGAIHIMDLGSHMTDRPGQSLLKIAEYPTVGCLFSRGDAIDLGQGQALLAYPSYIENYLVTVRLLGSNATTIHSGTANRYFSEQEKTCSVFDMVLMKKSCDEFYLSVGFEDGFLCVFKIFLRHTKSLPVLGAEGLKIDLIRSFDLKIGDFVSAFDVIRSSDSDLTLICGSPLKVLKIIKDKPEDQNHQASIDDIPLKKQGVSDVAIRPDHKLFAVAGWDSSVKLYSMKSRCLLAILGHHMKQVSQILFVERPSHEYSETVEHAIKPEGRGKFLLCCASMEGTISISAIY